MITRRRRHRITSIDRSHHNHWLQLHTASGPPGRPGPPAPPTVASPAAARAPASTPASASAWTRTARPAPAAAARLLPRPRPPPPPPPPRPRQCPPARWRSTWGSASPWPCSSWCCWWRSASSGAGGCPEVTGSHSQVSYTTIHKPSLYIRLAVSGLDLVAFSHSEFIFPRRKL